MSYEKDICLIVPVQNSAAISKVAVRLVYHPAMFQL